MPTNTAAPRSTESPREGALARGARPRGRPVGSKNKPKSLVPTELANELLIKMEPLLPPEHYTYLRGVVRDGKAIATKNELDTLILLLSRNIYPALVGEMNTREMGGPDDTDDADARHKYDGPIFRKDVTERLKVLNSLLALRSQIEKRESEEKDGEQPILKLYADRSLAGRVAVLVGGIPSNMAGDHHEPEREPDGPRTVSGEVLERPLALPSGEQGEANRI